MDHNNKMLVVISLAALIIGAIWETLEREFHSTPPRKLFTVIEALAVLFIGFAVTQRGSSESVKMIGPLCSLLLLVSVVFVLPRAREKHLTDTSGYIGIMTALFVLVYANAMTGSQAKTPYFMNDAEDNMSELMSQFSHQDHLHRPRAEDLPTPSTGELDHLEETINQLMHEVPPSL